MRDHGEEKVSEKLLQDWFDLVAEASIIAAVLNHRLSVKQSTQG